MLRSLYFDIGTTFILLSNFHLYIFSAPALRSDSNSLLNRLLSSRADSTAKKYISEIKNFFAWCRTKCIPLIIPFSTPVVALYLFHLDQQSRSPASMVLVHAAMKWLHSFAPEDVPNPLDNACSKNIIKSAQRTRSQPINKKKPANAEVIKNIIGKNQASLKDLRIAVISALGFAGFFRVNELCLKVKLMCIEKGIMSTLQS